MEDKYFLAVCKDREDPEGFYYRHRFDETVKLFPLFEMTVGLMNRNSDGTALWLAMGLAIKEVYGFRRETLKKLLEKINNRK